MMTNSTTIPSGSGNVDSWSSPTYMTADFPAPPSVDSIANSIANTNVDNVDTNAENTSANSNANTGNIMSPNNASNGSRVPMFAVFIGIALGLIIIISIHAVGTFISQIVFAVAIILILITRTVKQCSSNGHENDSTNSTSSCYREFGCFGLSLCILLVGIGIGFGIIYGVDILFYYFLDDYSSYDFRDAYWTSNIIIFAVAVLSAIALIIRAVKRCKTNASTNASHSAYNMDLSIIIVGTALGLAIVIGICTVDRSISLQLFGVISVLVVIVWRITTAIKNKRAGTINNNPSTSTNNEKYPSDSYSFLAIYGPISDTDLFCFGLMVFLFQAALLILMVLSVVEQKMRTSGEVDNPDSDSDWLAGFIPTNVSPLVRTTQIISILSYMIFAEDSLLDISKAIEMFPRLDKASRDDKTGRIAFACILRFAQGILVVLAVFLLVMTSSEVIEVILNFTAVNFISALDEIAFYLAKIGKYGPMMKEATEQIEQKPIPRCSYRKHKHMRYRFVVIPIAIVLLVTLYYIGFSQESNNKWITSTLKVQFEETFDEASNLQIYNGCYNIDEEVSSSKRHNYKFLNDDSNRTQFGYCKEKRRWILFKSINTDPCQAGEDELAHSSKTDSFDISTSFGETWYSVYNTPLDLFFFELGDKDKQEQCLSFDDGICDGIFNTFEFKYDEGDCCAATCTRSNCGIGVLKNAFDTEILSNPGNGFPTCIDHNMVPVTIRLDQINIGENGTSSNDDQVNPKLKLDCDGRNVFLINADQSMEMKNETVMVRDGANCTFKIEEVHIDTDQSWEVDYSVFYGYNKTLDDEQFEIYRGQSNSTTKNDDYFSVYHIFSKNSITGKIGLLTNLTRLESGGNFLTGTFPTEIGLLTNLNTIDLAYNSFTGTFPSEIGLLANLNTIDLGFNSLTGTVPSEIGLLENLTYIDLSYNSFTGTFPSEIGLLENLTYIDLRGNSFTGTVPSGIGLLTNLNIIDLGFNSLTGTVPSQIGLLSNLEYLQFDDNYLTGSIPCEVQALSAFDNFYIGWQRDGLSGQFIDLPNSYPCSDTGT